VIPGAVAVKHTSAGTVRELTTNSAGAYVAAALAQGHYNLTVAASGFRMYQAQGITLRVAQNARIDVTLKVGSETSRLRYRLKDWFKSIPNPPSWVARLRPGTGAAV
jgi:hypothetical protein